MKMADIAAHLNAEIILVVTEEKDEINVPIALSAPRDGDQGPSKVTKTEPSGGDSVAVR